MSFPDSNILLLYAVLSICWAASISWLLYRQKSAFPGIPGSDGLISSYLVALRFLRHPNEVIVLGCNQDRNGVFRFARLFNWEYVAVGRKRVAELTAAPSNVLSSVEALADTFQTDYTLGLEFRINPYHIGMVQGPLTRNLNRCFPRVRDEIVHAFDHVLGLHENVWNLVQIFPASVQIVARTSNRLFFDLPICRESEYLQLCIDNAVVVFTYGPMLRRLPKVLRPILGPFLSPRKQTLHQALKFLGPLIDERLEQEKQCGRDWPGRPNDLISWLLDVSVGEGRTKPVLAQRALIINAVAIHSSAMALTSALYDLTTYPEHILPMREEVERVIAAQGWTKAALNNMHKIDSFLRESMRFSTSTLHLRRKVVAKDGFRFSDGTTIPYGSFISVPGKATHHDPANYDEPEVFDGFRLSRLREERHGLDAGERSDFFNSHMISTAPEYIAFGHGQHACPGRFFAATELKAMLAHMLINYDIKAETDLRPPDICISEATMPNPQGKIWIRKRE
ncbi:hypothetical protein MVEN_01395100 [Mycena venus]|uniref:Cytochrome P450 n=1 Tax=Mycena venus TaxID=2733690 RepID=A0A8H7CSJ5_9AGAR|nr:hypothetical protein MVEN_01395100 [Mycena venus]